MSNPLLQPRYHEFDAHGVRVKIRNISERERAKMLEGLDLEAEADNATLRNRLVALVLVEVDGATANLTAEQVDDMGFDYLSRISKEAQRHCGFIEADSGNSLAATVTSTDSPQP